MPLSVVAEIDPELIPPDFEKTTARPPAVSVLPAASFVVKVRVSLDPEVNVPLDTLTKDCASETAPGVTVTVGKVEVTVDPPIEAEIVVAVPEVVPVKVAV